MYRLRRDAVRDVTLDTEVMLYLEFGEPMLPTDPIGRERVMRVASYFWLDPRGQLWLEKDGTYHIQVPPLRDRAQITAELQA